MGPLLLILEQEQRDTWSKGEAERYIRGDNDAERARRYQDSPKNYNQVRNKVTSHFCRNCTEVGKGSVRHRLVRCVYWLLGQGWEGGLVVDVESRRNRGTVGATTATATAATATVTALASAVTAATSTTSTSRALEASLDLDEDLLLLLGLGLGYSRLSLHGGSLD